MGQMGKWPWQCTTTGLDNSTELRMEKIRPAVTEIWVPQVWQPPAHQPARPNRDDNTPPARGVKRIIWVRPWGWDCLVSWFCHQLIPKSGNKTVTPSWSYTNCIALLCIVHVPKNNHGELDFNNISLGNPLKLSKPTAASCNTNQCWLKNFYIYPQQFHKKITSFTLKGAWHPSHWCQQLHQQWMRMLSKMFQITHETTIAMTRLKFPDFSHS